MHFDLALLCCVMLVKCGAGTGSRSYLHCLEARDGCSPQCNVGADAVQVPIRDRRYIAWKQGMVAFHTATLVQM